MKLRSLLLGGAAVAIGFGGMPGQVFAQDDSSASESSGGLDIITVTARRQDETLQDAGIAIDAVTGEGLASSGVVNAMDITRSVPAVSLTSGGANITSIYLRGVGNNTTSTFNDSAVSANYDGVAIGRSSGLLGAAFYDLARIEVLKGPQGILYGRNSTGGNFNVIPNHPELGELSGGGSISYGNFDALNLDAHVNVPIGEEAAVRIAGARLRHDGYYNDGTGDQDVTSLRGQLLFEPSDTFSLRIGADWTHLGGSGPGGSYVGLFRPTPPSTSNPAGSFTFIPVSFAPNEGLNSPASNAFRRNNFFAPANAFYPSIRGEQNLDSDYWGIHAELAVETGLGTLTVIPAYRSSTDHSQFFGPAFDFGTTNEDIDQYSVETRLSGSSGIVEYQVGGIWYREDQSAQNSYNQVYVLPLLTYDHDLESLAAFGQLTFNVTESLRLIGGMRYTHDSKNIAGSSIAFVVSCTAAPSPTGPCATSGLLPQFPGGLLTPDDAMNFLRTGGYISPTATFVPQNGPPTILPLINGAPAIIVAAPTLLDQGVKSGKVTWRAGVEYDVAPDSLLYASVETGYRAGGVQVNTAIPFYDPETITTFTVGSKNRFLNNRLQVNVEAFHWRYRDQQQTYFTAVTGVLQNVTDNVGDVNITGFDLDVIARPFENTTLGAKVQYLDATYSTATLTTAFPRTNFACPATATGSSTLGNPSFPIVTFDCSGRPPLFSPKWTFNFDVEQIVPISNSLELVGTLNAAYRDDQFGASDYVDFELIPSYWLFDTTLTLRDLDAGWSLGGFVRNIGNTRRDQFPQSVVGLAVAHYNAPRTYGVRATVEF